MDGQAKIQELWGIFDLAMFLHQNKSQCGLNKIIKSSWWKQIKKWKLKLEPLYNPYIIQFNFGKADLNISTHINMTIFNIVIACFPFAALKYNQSVCYCALINWYYWKSCILLLSQCLFTADIIKKDTVHAAAAKVAFPSLSFIWALKVRHFKRQKKCISQYSTDGVVLLMYAGPRVR